MIHFFQIALMSNVEINIGGKYAYRRDCIIGHGSFAIVFKGWHLSGY